MPERCCQSPRDWKGQASAPWTRPQHTGVLGRVAAAPGTPSASSLLSHLGLSGSYGSSPPASASPPHSPGCSHASLLQGRGCGWDLFLFLASCSFAPFCSPAPAAAFTLPSPPPAAWLGQNAASPPHPALRARGYPQARSSSQFQGSLWSPPRLSLCLNPPALLLPPSQLPPSPPCPPCHLPHAALAGGSGRSKISACTFLGWQSDKREEMDPSLIVLSLRRAHGVLGTQPHRWGCSPKVSIPPSQHPPQPPAAPAQPPASPSL